MNYQMATQVDLLFAQETFIKQWRHAISKAHYRLDLNDAREGDDEWNDELMDLRHHCGVCQANVVIELLEPVLRTYVTKLEAAAGLPTMPAWRTT